MLNRKILFTGQSFDSNININELCGLTVTVLPFIKTIFCETASLRNIFEILIKQEAQVIVTSQIAAQWITNASAEIPEWKIACMSGRTEEVFMRMHWEKNVFLTEESSEALAKTIENKFNKTQPVYFFTGDLHLNTLPLFLSKKGFQIETIITYNTIKIEQPLNETYDGIIFLSPSAVRSFFNQHRINEKIPLFSIGKTTAKAIKSIVPNPVVIAPVPNQKVLFNVIQQYFQKPCNH